MRRIRAPLGLLTALLCSGAASGGDHFSPERGRPAARAPDSRPVVAASRPAEAGPDSLAAPDTSLVFRIEIGSRLYPGWTEEQRVRLAETFHLGDSEYWAKTGSFLPDFRLGPEGAFSASRAWKNPAVQVIVYSDTTATDSTWAFRDFPPHYSPRSFFTFKLLEILVPEPKSKAGS